MSRGGHEESHKKGRSRVTRKDKMKERESPGVQEESMKQNRRRVTSRTVGQSLEGQEERHEEDRRKS